MGTELYRISELQKAITNGDSIAFVGHGYWYSRWDITKLFRREILGCEEEDNRQLLRYMNRYLRSLEIRGEDFLVKRRRTEDLDKLSTIIDSIKTRLKDVKNDSFTKAVRTSTIRMHALKYRKMSQAEIFAAAAERNKNEIQIDRDFLKKEIAIWKAKQKPAIVDTPESLMDEAHKIEETLQYPKIIELLRNDVEYRAQYFKFVFKSSICSIKNAVAIAVQFPCLQRRLTKSYFDKWVKRLPKSNGIQFAEDIIQKATESSTPPKPKIRKTVSLLINSEQVVLNNFSKEVRFNGNPNTVFTIRDIFDSFAKTNDELGKYTFTEDKGVDLFREIDVTKENCFLDVPIFERLTKDELIKRYKEMGDHLQNGNGLITLKSSRQHQDNAVHDTHAWFEITIPNDDGTYSVRSIGKYAKTFPKGLFETFLFIFKTVRATLYGPDPNECYTHREQFAVPLPATKEHLVRFIKKMQQDFIKAKDGKLIFQMQGNNCAAWVQETIDYVYNEPAAAKKCKLPRVFEINMLETTAPAPVNYIIATIKTLATRISETVANAFRILVSWLFGASTSYSSEKKVSLMTDQKWQKGKMDLPSQLFKNGTILQRAIVTQLQRASPTMGLV